MLHKNQEPVLYKSTKCWVLPVKTYLTAPYLVKGVSKKLNFGFTFDLSHSLIYGEQNQNWIINKNRIALLKNRFFKNFFWKRLIFAPTFLRIGWRADKPPRPLRSERSRKADGTASSRIACQESTLWQCYTRYTVWCHAFKFSQAALYAPFERRNARRRVIILPTAFSDLLCVTRLAVR